jgi:Kef-type K+ transport system membrane component KefB
VGTLAIACAAVDYVTVWCILAYIVGLARASGEARPLWLAPVGLGVFAAFMVLYVRGRLRSLETAFLKDGRLSNTASTAMLVVILGSALVTDALGIHLLFGAFLAGAIMPRNARLTTHIKDRLEWVTLVMLLPVFFALTGLRTRIDLITGAEMWLYCGLIVAVAIAGKAGGAALAARMTGLSWREAGMAGILLNTRGLMEIVVLSVGLDIQVISPGLFSMMVIMALVTTLMTAPVLELVDPSGQKPAQAVRQVTEPVAHVARLAASTGAREYRTDS